MARPRKKQAYWESKKAEAGRLQAQYEFAKKLPLTDRLWYELKSFIKPVDAIEALAVIGVYITLRSQKDLLTKAIKATEKGIEQLPLGFPALQPLQRWVTGVKGTFTGITVTEKTTMEQGIYAEFFLFGLAYIIVHNFGELISMGKSVISIASSLVA